MMRQLFKYGIISPSHQNINKPGPNARLFRLTKPIPMAPTMPKDVYLINKFNALTPDSGEMVFPSKSIGHIEAALKNISDLVHENEIHKEYSSALQNKRTLMGLQRVGPIAMNMMLTGERRAHLVLNCARRPTKTLLEMVGEKVIDMLKHTERPFANFTERKEHLELYKESVSSKVDAGNKKGVHFQVKEAKIDEDVSDPKKAKVEGEVESGREKTETTEPEEVIPEYYNCQIEHQNSGFLITYGIVAPYKMVVRVTLTSLLLRDDNDRKVKKEEETTRRAAAEAMVKKEAVRPAVRANSSTEEVKDEPEPEPEEEIQDGFAPLMPDEDDAANFKFGPYDEKMNLEECEIIEKEEGPLPTQPGLGALAELRRVKWFQHVGMKTPYLPEMCRLIRGLAIREQSWRSFRILCPWSIALILNVIINFEVNESKKDRVKGQPAMCPLSYGKLFDILLECLARGFRFPVAEVVDPKKVKEEVDVTDMDAIAAMIKRERKESDDTKRSEPKKPKRYTHRLADPCELDTTHDALSHLSTQRKADIRACAKYALDLMGRNQTCLLLNVEQDREIEKMNERATREEASAR